MTEARSERLALFERLEPSTEFSGGRIAPTDVLTLNQAARLASRHASEEVAPADFLRAAARGEIQLHAIAHRSARIRTPNGGRPIPEGAIVWLPIGACRQLAAAGRASWRAFDGKASGAWELEPDEPDFETVPDDCRVTGRDAHALADAFRPKRPRLSQLRMNLPQKPLLAKNLGADAALLCLTLEAYPEKTEELHGVTAEEAARTLRCFELARLEIWDRADMHEAATVESDDDAERRRWLLPSRAEIARRIDAAARAWSIPEVLPPAEALAFLERCGVFVFGELRDAVEARHEPHDGGVSDEPDEVKGSRDEPEETAHCLAADGPPPLDTRTMARVLDGIKDRGADRWRRLLADCPDWAVPARVMPGRRGGESARWNPVKLAGLLVERGASQQELAALFRDKLELEEWRGAYQASRAVFADYGL